MKEYPDANYPVKIYDLAGYESVELWQMLPTTFVLDLNRSVDIAVTPALKDQPWPPPWPSQERWEIWDNAQEAANYLFTSHDVVVAPWTENHVDFREFPTPDDPDSIRSAFFLPQAQFDELLRDCRMLMDDPDRGYSTRLSELIDRPMWRFLVHELPRATLREHNRHMIGLPPRP